MTSIVILTFNSQNFIRPCFDAIFSQIFSDIEVIVVDNGSEDKTVSFIENNYPQIKLIKNRCNLGASIARNQGIKLSRGDWILALDSDVVIEKDFLRNLINFTENLSEDIVALQPKILSMDKKHIYSCGIHLSVLRRFYDIDKGRKISKSFNVNKYIFGPTSAAAFYRRKMLEEIEDEFGYFDERFFFLVEDVDLAWRCRKKGWKTLFYSKAICYHYGNGSLTSPELRNYLCFRNRYFMLIKNQSRLSLVIHLFLSFFYDFPRFIFYLINNKFTFKAIKEISDAL